jgi:4-amino-4-deoxy-L-arabinose transferase-like glycosyltransferase
MKNISNKIKNHCDIVLGFAKRIPLSLILLTIGIIVYSYTDVYISSDMSAYLNAALDYYNNGTSELLPGRPLFPILISWSFNLFGISPLSAFWLIRFFAIANPLIVYAIGKKLFNKSVGFIAGLFILSSYAVNYWSYRHLDAIWPFFILCGIYFLILHFDKNRIRWIVLSALCFAGSVAIKEAAVIFLALPFFLMIKIKKNEFKNRIWQIVLFYLIVIAAMSPFLFNIFARTIGIIGAGSERISAHSTSDINSVFNNGFINTLINYFVGLSKFVYAKSAVNSLYNNINSSVLILFAISWLNIFYLVIKKNFTAKILAVCLLLNTITIAYCGFYDMRVGQHIFFLLLSYFVVAIFLQNAYIFAINRMKLLQIKKKLLDKMLISMKIVMAVIVISVLLVQTFSSAPNGTKNINWIKGTYFYQSVFVKDDTPKITLRGGWADYTQLTANWILRNIPEKSKFIFFDVDGERGAANELFFYTQGKYEIVSPKYKYSKLTESFNKEYANLTNDLIAFFYNGSIDRSLAGRFTALSEQSLQDQIHEENIDYLIVGLNRNFFNYYLENNDSFEKIFEFTQTGLLHIYKIKKPIEISSDFQTMIDIDVVDILKNEYKLESANYEKLKQVLINKFHYNQSFIDNLIEDKYPYIVQKRRGCFEGRLKGCFNKDQ